MGSSQLDIQVTVNSSEDVYSDRDGYANSCSSEGEEISTDSGESSSDKALTEESDLKSGPSQIHQDEIQPSQHEIGSIAWGDRPKAGKGSANLPNQIAGLRDNPEFYQLVLSIMGKDKDDQLQTKKKFASKKHVRKEKGKILMPSMPKAVINRSPHNKIKSPSDTTIYAPAMGRIAQHNVLNSGLGHDITPVPLVMQGLNNNFPIPEKLRRKEKTSLRDRHRSEWRHRSRSNHIASTQAADTSEEESGSDVADNAGDHSGCEQNLALRRLVLDAEKFKASVEQPKGINTFNEAFDLNEIKCWIMQSEDDEFFHLTCHIDSALRVKIQNGEFMDLTKLLPKNRFQTMNDEQRMHFVNKNGESIGSLQILNKRYQELGTGSRLSGFMRQFIVKLTLIAHLKFGSMYML